MPLRITKSTDAITVERLIACIYSTPGLGKSTLGFTAEKPLLLDFDGGSHRAKNRGDVVRIAAWRDVTDIRRDDLADYRTLIVDTAGRALDALTIDIIEGNPKLGRGGALTLQGFGELKARFLAWANLIKSLGLDIVLIAHADEQRKGDDLIVRLDIQGGSKNEIYKSADLMGQLDLSGGKRYLNFSPTDTAFGKNPAELPVLEVPHYAQDPQFLAGLLARVKADLNRQSGEQQQVAGILADWKARIDEASDADDFNKLIPETQQAAAAVRENVKRLLTSTAKKKGFNFDREAGAFVTKQEKKAAA